MAAGSSCTVRPVAADNACTAGQVSLLPCLARYRYPDKLEFITQLPSERCFPLGGKYLDYHNKCNTLKK